MPYFWCRLESGAHGTVMAAEQASAIAKCNELKPDDDCETATVIPYPASPVWDDDIVCPPFCTTPETCKGRHSCPKSYACSE